MGRYFGTDGIRGKANVTLDVNRAFKVGQYLGYYYSQNGKAKIVVGKDTRLSSSMFENAIAAGASSSGADVYLVGYCPTPSIAYLTNNSDFNCGIMISASHNPYYDNGIKVFSHDGVKLDASIEALVEDYIDGKIEVEMVSGDHIGRVIDYHEGLDRYLDWMQSLFDFSLEGFSLAIDCANGSSCTTADRLLKKMGAKCTIINDQPNGLNINTNCGSTHPEALQDLVRSGDYDLGLAFDGDADRLIAVDSNGDLVTGDHILYMCGNHLKAKKHLKGNVVVTTVMANLGLFKAFEKCGIDTKSTQVGDKYVYECMCKEDFVLGGEQSGHIIFKEHMTTGDGLLTALKILETMHDTKKSVVELCKDLKIYPQLLVNIKVEDKNAVMEDKDVLSMVAKVEEDLHGNGRILVRTSGTEPLVRVMAEAETDEICKEKVYEIIDFIKSKYPEAA